MGVFSFLKTWQFWEVLLAFFMFLLAFSQGCLDKEIGRISGNVEEISDKVEKISDSIKNYTAANIPLEEIKYDFPSIRIHSLSNPFIAEVSFCYSGLKTATYFIEWEISDEEDNIIYLKDINKNSVNTIKESDNTKFVTQSLSFNKVGNYTILSKLYYYIGPNKEIESLNSEEFKNKIKKDYLNNKNMKVVQIPIPIEVLP